MVCYKSNRKPTHSSPMAVPKFKSRLADLLAFAASRFVSDLGILTVILYLLKHLMHLNMDKTWNLAKWCLHQPSSELDQEMHSWNLRTLVKDLLVLFSALTSPQAIWSCWKSAGSASYWRGNRAPTASMLTQEWQLMAGYTQTAHAFP